MQIRNLQEINVKLQNTNKYKKFVQISKQNLLCTYMVFCKIFVLFCFTLRKTPYVYKYDRKLH